MELKDQVTNVEISNKIHDLGITTPSLYYREWKGAKEDEIKINKDQDYCPDNVNCYTAAELWKHLPQFLQDREKLGKGYNEELCMGRNDPKDGNDDYTYVGYGFKASERDDKPANALAKLIIYLKENSII